MIRIGILVFFIVIEMYICMFLIIVCIELKLMIFKMKNNNECILGVINNICFYEYLENIILGMLMLEL